MPPPRNGSDDQGLLPVLPPFTSVRFRSKPDAATVVIADDTRKDGLWPYRTIRTVSEE